VRSQSTREETGMSDPTNWTTWRGVKYVDWADDDSLEMGFATNACRMVRRLKVQWTSLAKVYEACKAFVGWAESPTLVGTNSTQRVISRHTPLPIDQLRNLSNNPFLYCVATPRVTGLLYDDPEGTRGDPDTRIIKHKLASITCEF